MKNRIIAFAITTNKFDESSYKRAFQHFQQLAQSFGYTTTIIEHGVFHIWFIFEGKIDNLLDKTNREVQFCVGPYITQYHSCLDQKNLSNDQIRDRFLKIKVSIRDVQITNDYVGSIPVYYSLRKHLTISNIEPVVVIDSETNYDDISTENLYGFMRYMHFIWDETLYSHIYVQEPDCQYIYQIDSIRPQKMFLKTLKSSKERIEFSDVQVANELYELNQELVERALKDEEEIVLPLSAGYDSRMILAAISKNKELKERLKCFTYGPEGSIEVESAKKLCSIYGVYWKRIDLPCHFLDRKYLDKIFLIFGSSLHLHGMYQLEVWENISNNLTSENAVLTSGFMTGVPAGQHISILGIKNINQKLTKSMNNFSQSKYWTDKELLQACSKFTIDIIDKVEDKYKGAFDRFDGELYQKSVVFDVWTRQRNFISYHPRVLEWEAPFVSPHMTPIYQNFFLSLSEKHLTDRKAVELMFKYHYPECAEVISNSNGLKSISNRVENVAAALSRVFRVLRLSILMPNAYKNKPLLFNIPALKHSGKEGLFPLFHLKYEEKQILNCFFDDVLLEKIYNKAMDGSITNYEKLLTIQALAYAINLINNGKNNGN